MSYPKPIPVDANKSPMQAYPPARVALQSFGRHDLSTSSVITFNDNATNLEITASGNVLAGSGVVIKWISTTDTTASVIATGATANFDHAIPANVTRTFVIPREGNATASLVGANVKEGLYRRVAWASSGGPASIFATTY